MAILHFPSGHTVALPARDAAKRSRIDCRFNGATVEGTPEEIEVIQAELDIPVPLYVPPKPPAPKDLKPTTSK